jgi:hypothetical protein
MTGNPPPPKKEVALALLERGSVHIHLDPRATGVVVPAWFKRQPQLVLQVGLNMPVPIPDLRVDEAGMSCTLSFNRSPFFCIVPWSSVYAMVGDDARGMVWPDDVPPEVAVQGRAREAEQAAKKPAPERQLAVVKSPPEPSQKPAARPRAVTPKGDAKKPRAKKPRPAPAGGAPPKAPRGRRGDGVLVLPASAKPAEPPPHPEPAGNAAVDTRAPRPTPPTPPAGSGKPGKVKREIPPYLRVVK